MAHDIIALNIKIQIHHSFRLALSSSSPASAGIFQNRLPDVLGSKDGLKNQGISDIMFIFDKDYPPMFFFVTFGPRFY